jgi:hypothetical protein
MHSTKSSLTQSPNVGNYQRQKIQYVAGWAHKNTTWTLRATSATECRCRTYTSACTANPSENSLGQGAVSNRHKIAAIVRPVNWIESTQIRCKCKDDLKLKNNSDEPTHTVDVVVMRIELSLHPFQVGGQDRTASPHVIPARKKHFCYNSLRTESVSVLLQQNSRVPQKKYSIKNY